MMIRKRGLSPVIATMLLVSLALVLAVIIYFWARSFIGESISKQGSAIELLCDDVSFEAEATAGNPGTIRVENLGEIPIYGIEVRKQGFGEVSFVSVNDGIQTISAGQTKTFELDSSVQEGEILVIPILLGEGEGKTKSHTCDEDYGYEARVSA